MTFLAEKVLPQRQILVVSCHAWRHERFREGLPAGLQALLAPVSLPSAGSPPPPA